ncbi:MAG: hypothetical protein CVU65_01410 [Deltaproteobacteria bacterium HGW-Deltaproteobacteria-22]|nr:MAG: hypothetical protein CVU65_01410 [Deltaproteobacteria bacterium HGW-Deltaproteobacteria-22]
MQNKLILVLVAGILPWFAVPARAQETQLTHDDGTPAGTVQNLAAGDIEVVRFFALHPATLLSLQLHFGAVGEPADVFVWGDNGGNAPDLDRVLWSGTVTPTADGWTEVDLTGGSPEIEPMQNFYVGHVLRDGATRLSWDASGNAETSSLVRISGEWYFVGDATGTQSVDALVRATVFWHDIVEDTWFTEITSGAGVSMGSRMAWGDFDNDGFDDLLINGSAVYRNLGDGTFALLSSPLGVEPNGANGGLWADYDNDGCLDFYATGYHFFPACGVPGDCIEGYGCIENRCMPDGVEELPHDRLYRGHCDGSFTDQSETAGRPYDYLPTEGAAWGDVDGDGWVDLYVANYETPTDWTGGVLSQGTLDYLWHNNGDGTFMDVSERSGIRFMGRGLCGRGVAMADWNEDGFLDIYVTNYRLQGNFFFRNLGDGTFENISDQNGTVGELVQGSYGHSIGSQWGDVNNDGHLDLFVANLAHPRFIEFSDKSMLYLNDGPPDYGFTESRAAWGITYSETHSDPALGDFDNDGYLDLYITDVYVGYQGFLYRNLAGAGFEDVTYASGLRIDNGWGVTFADIDNDGDLDFLANRFYRNDVPGSGNWLKLRLRGTRANAAAIGAVVTVRSGEKVWVRQVEGSKGTTTQNPLTLHFGLGDTSVADSVHIRWPRGSGEEQELTDVAVNQTLLVVQPNPDAGTDADTDADGEPDRKQDEGCSCATGTRSGSFLVFFGLLIVVIGIANRKKLGFFHR